MPQGSVTPAVSSRPRGAGTLELRRLSKYFGDTHAVDGVDVTIGDGEFLAILGPSGCGKSTLMRMIAGLETPSVGQIILGGRDVTALPPRARDVSMVFQSYALYPNMSVAENIAFPLKVRHVPRAERDAKIKWVAEIMRVVPLLKRRPGRLSGGEKQRVALARSLVRDPAVFIFDEPLSALDAQVRAMARNELRQLHDRTGITTVYVTHDQVEALGMGDRVAVMEHGKVHQLGEPRDLYNHPADTFVASFVGTPPMNLLPRGERIIGFRPEFLTPNPPATVHDGGLRLSLRILQLEFLGSEWLVYGQLDNHGEEKKVIAKIPPAVAPTLATGEECEFGVERAHLRFFDSASGLRVEDGEL